MSAGSAKAADAVVAALPAAAVVDSGVEGSAPADAPVVVQPAVVVEVVEVRAAAATPVVAVASAEVSGVDPSTGLGGGGDPLVPVLAPLGWSVVAASRRELSGAPAPAAAAAVPAAAAAGDPAALEAIDQALTVTKAFLDFVSPILKYPPSDNPVHDILNFLVDSTGAALAVPANQQQLGVMVTQLVNAVAADAGMRAQIGTALRQALPTALGDTALANAIADAAEAFLADPELSGAIAAVAGSAVSSFVGHLAIPNVIDAVKTMALGVVDALMLTGTDPFVPVTAGLAALQASPALLSAMSATVPAVVGAMLGNPAVAGAFGDLATDLVSSTLHSAGINVGFLDAGLGAFASTAVTQLMGSPAVGHLIDKVVLDFIYGAPVNDVINAAVQSVLQDQALQGALGSAVGAALGTAVFGDNAVGQVAGMLAGAMVSVTLGVLSSVVLVFTGPGAVAGSVSGTTDASLAAAEAAAATSPFARMAAALAAAAVAWDPAAIDPRLPSAAHTMATIATVVGQFLGWPEAPNTVFTTAAQYPFEVSLDAALATIDYYAEHPTPDTQWIADMFTGLASATTPGTFTGYTKFSDVLKIVASGLNRLIPPYSMAVWGVYRAQVAIAAVGALLRISSHLANGISDMETLSNAGMLGGMDAFIRPNSILNQSFFSLATGERAVMSLFTFVAMMAAFDRFKDVGTNQVPVVTSIEQYGRWALTVSGKLNATDPNGDNMSYTFTEPSKGLVTVNADGSWLYTRSADYTHTDVDSFTITINDIWGVNGDIAGASLDHPYAPNGHTTTATVYVHWEGLKNNAPTAAIVLGVRNSAGIIRGYIDGNDIDGDPLTYSLVNPGTTGATPTSIYTSKGAIVQIDPTSGHYVYIPNKFSITTDSFQVVVSDGAGGTSTQTVVPTTWLSLGSATTSTGANTERGRVSVAGADIGLLTYSLGAAPTKGTVTVNADGTYTYVRSSTATGGTTDTFTIIGTDANGKSVTLPTVSVSPPPTTVIPTTTATGGTWTPRTMLNGTATVPGTQTVTGNFSGVDQDGTAVTVKAGSYTSARGGTVTVTAGGGFLYTRTTYNDMWHRAAAEDATAADKVDTVTINVTDAHGISTEGTYSITLRQENSAPSGDYSVDSTDAIGVVRGTMGGSDYDGDSLSYTLLGMTGSSAYTAHGGIVTLSGSTFTYIPNGAAYSSDTFQVKVSDGHGGTATQTVTVPQSTPSGVRNVSTATVGTVTGQLNISAADAGLMTYSLGAGPSKGTVTVNADGTFTYVRTTSLGHTTTPNDSFTVTGTEVGTGKTVTIATINVTPAVINTAPVGTGVTVTSSSLADSDASFNRKQSTSGKLNYTDLDGDAVTFAAGTYGTSNGGDVTVNADGTFSYSYKRLKGTEDLYWHNAAITGAPGTIFGVMVTDAFGGSTTVYYSIPIEKMNSAPSGSVSANDTSTDALGVVRGTLSGSDSDSYYNYITLSTTRVTDDLSYTLAGAGNPTGATATTTVTANGGIVNLNGDQFTYIPTVGASTDSFKVLVSDGHGGSTAATVNLSGLSTPSPVKNIDKSVDGTVTGALDIPAGDAVLMSGFTYSVGTGPSKGTVTVNANGTFTYTRTPGLGHTTTPNDSFTIKGTDALGRTVTIANVNVAPGMGNNAPIGTGVTVTSSSLSRVIGPNDQQDTSGKLNATDPDGDTVSFAAGTYDTAQGGSITVNANGTFSYSIKKYAWFGVSDSYWHDHATPSDPGDTFTINVSDAFGGTTAVTYGVPIERKNSAPSLSGSVSSSSSDGLGVVRGSISGGSDGDDDGLTYSLVGASGGSVYTANGGIVTLSGTSFTYIPKVGVATDSFQVQVNDGHFGTATATVNLSGLTTPSPVKNIDTTTAGTVTGGLNVPAGDAGLLSNFTVGTGPTKGTVTVNTDGTFTYTRTAGLGHTTTAADTFTIKGTDAAGKSVTIATINVTPSLPNTAPTATLTTAPTEGSLSGTIQTSTGTITASDADSDTLTYTASGLASGASVVFQSNGSFTYTTDISTANRHAAAKYGATAAQKNQTFTVTVADGYLGGTASVVVTVPIYAVNTPPVVSKTKAALTYTIKVTDAEDTIPTTKNPATGSAGYSVSNGATLTGILSAGVLYTTTATVTVTAWDGYYVVTNGKVTTTLASTTA